MSTQPTQRAQQAQPFNQFVQASSEAEQTEFAANVHKQGYPLFYPMLEGFRERIKSFQDEEFEEVIALIEKGRKLFPEPGRMSPSWQKVWDQLDATVRQMKKAMDAVPRSDREGEWQIIMDNPYSHEDIVCYPALSFQEAAYLYGYFSPELQRNEYIRMQKIVSLIAYSGE